MTKYLSVLFMVAVVSCKSDARDEQLFSDINFENEVIKYKPLKRSNVSEVDYNRAKRALEATISAVGGKRENFVVTDYWNITYAFALLNEPKKNIELAFNKGVQKDFNSMCEYIKKVSEISEKTIYLFKKAIPNTFNEFSKSCNKKIVKRKKKIIRTDYKEARFNRKLVKLISTVEINDQKFRSGVVKYRENLAMQSVIDKKNQEIIDSLYGEYNRYIGSTLVGSDYKSTMWAVIQHSNIKMMKKYLPVIHQAVKDKELPKEPLKMLIDRIYTIEQGYQIFGSQAGVDIINKKIQIKIITRYDMDNL